ncbi:MAG: VanZ family protein [Limisphaerales bacterium]
MMIRKSIALAFTLAVLTLGCFWPVRVRVDASFWGHVFDMGHIPMLAWLAAVLLYALPERVQPPARRHVVVFALAFAFAVGIELLQPFFGRSRSLADVINGAIGAGLALTGIVAWQQSGSWLWRGGHALALAGALMVALWPAYEEWRGIRWRQMHFPSLGDFEDAAELRLWRSQGGSRGQPTNASLTRARASQGEQSLRVVGGAGDWAGVSYSAGDKDWTAFRALSLDVFNPRDPFTIFVRVDDNGDCAKLADRFERGFELARGWNRLRVPTAEIEHGPKERRLNMKAVRRVSVFSGDGEPQRFWFLDNVRLERRGED